MKRRIKRNEDVRMFVKTKERKGYTWQFFISYTKEP